MTDSQNRPASDQAERPDDGRGDLAEHEQPEVGLIGDEDLPEDLQPTDDNPLAKDPDEGPDDDGGGERKVEGMPDMGDPGAPA